MFNFIPFGISNKFFRPAFFCLHHSSLRYGPSLQLKGTGPEIQKSKQIPEKHGHINGSVLFLFLFHLFSFLRTFWMQHSARSIPQPTQKP